MSDLLTRLAERALGLGAPPVQPRLHSRFAEEPGAAPETAVVEEHAEVPPPPSPPAAERGRAAPLLPPSPAAPVLRRYASPAAPPPAGEAVGPERSPEAAEPPPSRAVPTPRTATRHPVHDPPAPDELLYPSGDRRPRAADAAPVGAAPRSGADGEPGAPAVSPPAAARPSPAVTVHAGPPREDRARRTPVELGPPQAEEVDGGLLLPPGEGRAAEPAHTRADAPERAPAARGAAGTPPREPARPPAAPRPDEPAGPAAERPAAAAGPREPTGAREAPTPPVRHLAAPRAEPAAAPRRALDPGEAPRPVVRVTIGRIEVRAVTPPPPPQPAFRPGWTPPVVGLDEYLRREGGR